MIKIEKTGIYYELREVAKLLKLTKAGVSLRVHKLHITPINATKKWLFHETEIAKIKHMYDSDKISSPIDKWI
jgi:hypothetical protein